MKSWEYKTVKLGASGVLGRNLDEEKLDEFMNDLGGEGWELVSAFDTNLYGNTKEVVAIFKRERS